MGRTSPADVAAWLRNETPHHLTLLTRLREKLALTMPDDVNEYGTPSRDWVRALQRYQGAFTALLTEERERIKLRILMNKSGEGMLTDEEYEMEMRSLAVESLGTLPADALHRELERRAAQAPRLVEAEDD